MNVALKRIFMLMKQFLLIEVLIIKREK